MPLFHLNLLVNASNYFWNMKLKLILPLLLIINCAVYAEGVDDLFASAITGNSARLKSLLAEGVEVNGTTANGRTALMAASFNGNVRAAKILLAYGADVNVHDDAGVTALMDSLVFGNNELVNLLIAAGADVNAIDNSNVSVLARAKKIKHKHIIKTLENANAKETTEAPKEQVDSGEEEVTVEQKN